MVQAWRGDCRRFSRFKRFKRFKVQGSGFG
jgi:hypothetical protein